MKFKHSIRFLFPRLPPPLSQRHIYLLYLPHKNKACKGFRSARSFLRSAIIVSKGITCLLRIVYLMSVICRGTFEQGCEFRSLLWFYYFKIMFIYVMKSPRCVSQGYIQIHVINKYQLRLKEYYIGYILYTYVENRISFRDQLYP